MLYNLPSSENIALPIEHQSSVSNLQLVDESSTNHGVMPPSYCANNYGSSCQNVHMRNDLDLREHQELGKDPSSLDQGECDGDVDSDATGKFTEAWNFGPLNKICCYCKAILWYEERSVKYRNSTLPKFSICCREGKVRLPPLRDAPDFLRGLLDYSGGRRTRKFKENIRSYNLIFPFTSTGGTIDKEINNGGGPYVYLINGQHHHRISSLLPPTGRSASFAQFYIYDTQMR
ncbi:UNVERIFIED_CONTAM: hypothetical protein Sradi_4037000 [Sesamum radiatum]|uniref:Helitron helicase-like domain-containing protein n=1 Tax=Sesamum radiatum TaxID=300843 RepID=A0AAW2PMY5_SESRA